MRVALLHDYLNQYGGGERVLEALVDIFPEADIYTLFYDERKTLGRFKNRVKKTSFLDWPIVRNHHRWFIPFMPLASKTVFVNGQYDLVISDTAGFAKGFNLSRWASKSFHLCYVHTPLRYAWEPDYINSKFKNKNSKFRNLFLKPNHNYLKRWDYKVGQKPDVLLANSNFIADKIKKYYNRDAEVAYPPVNVSQFFYEPKQTREAETYYLAIGRMLHYKRFDLIIESFAKLGLPLKIIGSGPEDQNLKVISHNLKAKNIEFIPFVDDENKLRKIYGGAEALIFPQVEDFGLVAAEAQACGSPIIAYRAGGAMEIVEDGVTGILFSEQNSESLITAVKRSQSIDFNRKLISEKAQRFSQAVFKKQLLAKIDQFSI
ncbi:MAG: glycosyltransferase [bacterium]|nr:glycosyltransferase [bacterium]